MQEVSQAWKTAQRQTLVPESYVEINLNVGDPDAQAAASASDNGSISLSNTPQTVDRTEKNPIPYTMLEVNSWILDGTRRLVPDSEPYGNNGYIGDELSDNDCTFGEK